MSTGRTIWIIFCCICCIGWLTFGWVLPIFNLFGAVFSLLAIMLPVGKTPVQRSVMEIKISKDGDNLPKIQ